MTSRPFHHTASIFLAVTFFFGLSIAHASDREDLIKASKLNDHAIELVKSGSLDEAEAEMLKALEYSSNHPKILKNLAVVYYEKGRARESAGQLFEAENYFKRTLEIEPETDAYRKALAENYFKQGNAKTATGRIDDALALYQKSVALDDTNANAFMHAAFYAWKAQRLDLAQSYFEKAKTLDPGNPNLKILESQLKGSQVEENMQVKRSEHFILTAEGGFIDAAGEQALLGLLESAYRDVAYKLNRDPKRQIPAVFMTQQEFHGQWMLPNRVSGFYDGKLRIPYGGQPSLAALKPALNHELTHAFLDALLPQKPPIWLSEGLAQWVEGKKIDRKTRDNLVTFQIARRAPDLAHLDQTLRAQTNPYNNTEMTLAYVKSFSVVEYLIEQKGIEVFLRLLEEISSAPLDTLLEKDYGMNVRELEERWRWWIERRVIT